MVVWKYPSDPYFLAPMAKKSVCCGTFQLQADAGGSLPGRYG